MSFACPRCGDVVEGRFYGPCEACRTQLRRTVGSAVRAVERTGYEPVMHVTPNAVALKDD